MQNQFTSYRVILNKLCLLIIAFSIPVNLFPNLFPTEYIILIQPHFVIII